MGDCIKKHPKHAVILFIFEDFIFCVYEYFTSMYMYVCHICARSLWRLGGDLRLSGPGVIHGYELPCG